MRNGCLVGLVIILGGPSLGCSGKRLHVGDDGAGGGGPGGAGPGGGGENGLSVSPDAVTFTATLVGGTSAPRTLSVHNGGSAAVAPPSIEGTNAADFVIAPSGCGAALQPGASCDVVVTFAPTTRSGARSARLAITAPSGLATSASLGGEALPALTLLAGGLGGPGDTDGVGDGARFNGPVGISGDGAGNLYVADTNNRAIRKIALGTGAVTTLAGNARLEGYQDGTGAAATFNAPVAITSDGAGNLYVADSGNANIRKVVIATGVVTTLADELGVPARIEGATGITSDGNGYLYVTTTTVAGGVTVGSLRKVSVATGTVTTVADRTGTSVRFGTPTDLASDGAGHLYVADGSVILDVVIATGAVTTLADGFGPAAGLASDGAGNLYVTEGGDTGNTVWKIVVATGAVTPLAGARGQDGHADGIGSAAQFAGLKGIASDGAGNVYVAESVNHAIRKVVVTTGAVTTVAGAPGREGREDGTRAMARFNGPEGIATDGSGNVYVAERDGYTIRRVVVATGVVTTLAGAVEAGSADGVGAAARFAGPTGLASDGAGNLYVADTGNSTIRHIDVATGAVTTFAGQAGTAGNADGPGAAATFVVPFGVAADGAGNLFVADMGSATIRQVVITSRIVTTLAGRAGEPGTADGTGPAARFFAPSGLAADGAGNLYVADSGNRTIRKIVVATGAVTTLAGQGGTTGAADGTGAAARFESPFAIASDGANVLYVTDFTGTVRKIIVDTATVSTLVGTAGRHGVGLGGFPGSLNGPGGIAVLPTGELAIVDTIEHAVLIGHP